MAKMTDGLLKQRGDILQRRYAAEQFARGWHSSIRKWRNLYDGKHYDSDPLPGEKRYVDPVTCNVVDLAVGIMQSNEYIWRSRGFIPDGEEQKGTSLIEKAIAGFIDINSDRYQYDHKYETNLNFVRDGGACLLGVWDKFIHDNSFEMRDMTDADLNLIGEQKVYYDLPLRIEVIDPLQLSMLPGGPKRWLAISREEEMTVYDAEETYQKDLDSFKGVSVQEKKDTKGKFIDYWELAYELRPEGATDFEGFEDAEELSKYSMRKSLIVQNAMMFNEEFITPLRLMDGYDDIPYTVSFYNPASRTDSSKWHSILSPLENPVRELEDTTNMRKRLMLMYTGLPLIARSKAGKIISIDKKIGNVVNLREGEDLGFPSWPGTPPDVDKHLEFARSRIQQSGFSDIMYGEGINASSGYGLSLMSDQNRIRLEPAIAQLENLWTWAARKWVKLATNFAPDAYMELYGHIRGEDFVETVKGGDLDKYSIRCEIKPEFPNEKVRNHSLAVQVAGILDPTTIMEEYLGQQQPDDIRSRKIQAAIEDNPLSIQYAMMKELEKRANKGDKIAVQMLQNMQQQLAPQNPQGGQEQPRGQENMLGTQGADGQPDAPMYAGQQEAQSIEAQANAAPGMDGMVG